MSIAKKQLVALTNKILERYFKQGFIPSTAQVLQDIDAAYANKTIGMPIAEYRPVTSREKSNPDDWNTTVDEISTDLELLYEENNDQISQIISNFNYYSVEAKKLERRIDEAQTRVNELLLLDSNSEGYLYSTYDDFSNLNQSDLANTSAWVDLVNKEVTLPQSKVGNVKLDLVHCSIVGSLPYGQKAVSATEIEPIDNMISDAGNNAWIERVTMSNTGMVSYQIDIDLTSLNGAESSRVQITPQVTGLVQFEVLYSEDGGINFRDIGTTSAQSTFNFDYPIAKFTNLRIIMSRDTYDEKSTLSDNSIIYCYYFGITNVSLLKIGFEESAIFQSQPLSVTNRQGDQIVFNKISLEATDDIPTGTNLNYYLAIVPQDSSKNLDFQPIVPITSTNTTTPKIIDCKSVSSTIPVANMPATGAIPYNIVNGVNFWKLTTIPNPGSLIVDATSPVMNKGINQFRQDWYTYALWADAHVPSLDDWITPPTNPGQLDPVHVTTNYINANGQFRINHLQRQTNYKFTSNFYCAKNTSYKANITVGDNNNNPNGTITQVNMQMYVNGKLVSTKTNISNNTPISTTWSFMQGWNEILILVWVPGFYVYVPATKTYVPSTIYNISDIYLNLGFNPIGNIAQIQAESQPMNYTSIFNLTYNVPITDDTTFAVDDQNNIILNDSQHTQGANYSIFFKYRVLNTLFTNQVVFKAELERGTDPNATPKLHFYRVRFD